MSIFDITGTIVLSMAPVFEVRGAIPFAITMGMNIWLALILAVAANILLIPVVFFFLDYIHGHLLRFNAYSKSFNFYLNRVRKRTGDKVSGVWPYFALFSFVGLPLPGTGVWTAVLVSWFFDMDRRKSYVALILGSVFVSLLVFLATLGAISIW